MPSRLSASLSNQGSFPPPALPSLRGTASPSATLPRRRAHPQSRPARGLRGTASPSATLPARPAPHGVPAGVCAPPTGLPVLLPSPSSMRATASTPAGPAGAYVAHFPTSGSLPRLTGGSAPALLVSRPAQRSLALWPAWSLGRPRRPVCSECFRPCRYLHNPLRLLPAGATACRAGFAPAEGRCLSTAHRKRAGNGSRTRRAHPSVALSGEKARIRPYKAPAREGFKVCA